ncbi:MAG: hypothetical protein GXO50_04620, partial [Chlorobi bacterium]|nr:hypothetical protein [Chlorobiota bacterium]
MKKKVLFLLITLFSGFTTIQAQTYFGGQNVINIYTEGANSVYASDIDGDGDIDMLSASSGDNKIAWYENDGNQNFAAHTIAVDADGAKSVYASDIDGDGDIDVLSASEN